MDKNRFVVVIFQKQVTRPPAHDVDKRDGPKKASDDFSPSCRATFLVLFIYIRMCTLLKPGFHIVVSVVSVVSVVRKKFIGQIQLSGNLPYKCSIQKKRQIQLFVRDKMNSICPMNFFRTTDTTIWKPGLI